ncbi:succinate dehydrogenase, FeS subunit [Candidatus Desulfarcum epimagneticum]|uniref:succinate dehydrogenase n=1 Tax=uncultured Desulfobacteraceae bacterium TaxID=218296 RepID=A0A484HEB9_9BACT|nr:succinate dehydrogenase, FeS subunit [uncultured Desulfobacteraceae bacterium]
MKITLRIRRHDPGTDEKPSFRDYEVEVSPDQRLLDAMTYVKTHLDGSLAFRRSCAHGVCGSDAMRVNGVERLACKTLIKDLAEKEGETVVIEPIAHLPVKKDLIVDQGRFFQKYRSALPYLINPDPPPGKERLQSPGERAAFDDATNCVLCACCYSACPVLNDNENFMGPAAVLQAYRFIADSRDQGLADRLPGLDREDGAWACQNHFECTKRCPRSIKITKRINQTKRIIDSAQKGSA